MNKLPKLAATTALLLLLPVAASAHSNNGKHEGWQHTRFLPKIEKIKSKNGTVTALSSTGFNITDKNGTVYTVTVTSSTTISQVFGGSLTLAGIHVNDKANVKGTVNGNQVSASKIIITPANTHKASGGGTVTAINGSSITVSQNHGGIVSTFTTTVSPSTAIVNSSNTTTSLASITVGSKIRIAGLWDEIANVLKAFKIKIK